MTKISEEEFYRAMPKVELHAHLNGSLRFFDSPSLEWICHFMEIYMKACSKFVNSLTISYSMQQFAFGYVLTERVISVNTFQPHDLAKAV